MPGDNLAQFKQILANLPEDRRKRLYDRLHAMPASQREAFISDFTRKYLSGQRKHPSKKTGTQVKANVSGKKPSSPNGSAQKKAQPANAQKKAQPADFLLQGADFIFQASDDLLLFMHQRFSSGIQVSS